jgi:PAS domain S-box-containing protein
MCGYTSAELIGRYPNEMVKSNQNKPEIFQSMNEALASGHTWKGQTFGGRKNGDSYPQDVRIIPVFAPSG